MESGSAVVGKEERKKKYGIYVEAYVLSYLRRESGSLELSEIYFYGLRKEDGKKLYVYGAGRDRGIAAFAEYEPLPELICRLTQAGPVFLVREPDGECRVNGFDIFYDNNEAMQNYLLEWTGSNKQGRAKKEGGTSKNKPVLTALSETGQKRTPHRAMSVQLCLILVALVAIVITSTDSYDKMENLNRSAREVFFAIENQEAEETGKTVRDTGEQEIVVERDTRPQGEAAGETREEVLQEDAGGAAKTLQGESADGVAEETPLGDDAGGTAEETPQEDNTDGTTEEMMQGEDTDGTAEETSQGEAADGAVEHPQAADDRAQNADSGAENPAEQEEQEENKEALSRNVTRYYEVEQGDTLYTISQKIYGDISCVDRICEMNEITDPDRIRSGQRIILP